MRPLTLIVMSVLFAGVAVGEEKAPASAPLPRVRLDPVTRKAVTVPVSTEVAPVVAVPASATGATPAVLMDRYVVKGKYEMMLGPMQPTDPTGPFTWQGGGRIYGRDVGAMRVEVGLWPYVDIFAENAKFEGPKTKQMMDFLRITW